MCHRRRQGCAFQASVAVLLRAEKTLLVLIGQKRQHSNSAAMGIVLMTVYISLKAG
jgi:hypothetical protein